MNKKAQMQNVIDNLTSPGMMGSKRGQFQVASGVIWGIVGFCLTIIVGLLVIGLLVSGGFFVSTSESQHVLDNLSANVTSGLQTVVGKIPTIFTIVVAVVILSIVGLLVLVVSKFMGRGGAGGGNFGQ